MTAEAMCPECGKTVWVSVTAIQTAPHRVICEECEEAERIASEDPPEDYHETWSPKAP